MGAEGFFFLGVERPGHKAGYLNVSSA